MFCVMAGIVLAAILALFIYVAGLANAKAEAEAGDCLDLGPCMTFTIYPDGLEERPVKCTAWRIKPKGQAIRVCDNGTYRVSGAMVIAKTK